MPPGLRRVKPDLHQDSSRIVKDGPRIYPGLLRNAEDATRWRQDCARMHQGSIRIA